MSQLSHRIKNPEIDAEIQEIFRSNKLAKKLLCYELNEQSYNILLIYNPEKMKLTTKVEYTTKKHGHLSGTASCSKKVCIIVDKKAPRALIKHLASSHNLSWWGRWRNLIIANGRKLQQQYTEKKRLSNSYTVYTYTPCTFYEAMLNAKPSEVYTHLYYLLSKGRAS